MVNRLKSELHKHADLLEEYGAKESAVEAAAPLVQCLSVAMRQAKLSISPAVHHLSDACKADVRAVLVRRASHIRHDLPLLVVCAADIRQRCARMGDPQQCLRKQRGKLSRRCADAVTQRLIDSSEDIALDGSLNAACAKVRCTCRGRNHACS